MILPFHKLSYKECLKYLEKKEISICEFLVDNINYGNRNKKVSEKLKGKKMPPNVLKTIIEKTSRQVCQYTLDGDLVAIFPSAHEAARKSLPRIMQGRQSSYSSSSKVNSRVSPHLSQTMLPLSRVFSSNSMMLPQAHSTS